MSSDAMRAEIETLVGKYARSIDEGDADLASCIWATTDDVSFIHPRGHQRGWDQVKRNLYERTMRDRFTRRKLQIYDLVIHLYENMAIGVLLDLRRHTSDRRDVAQNARRRDPGIPAC